MLPAGRGDYEIVYRIDAPPHGRLVGLFVHSSVRGEAEGDPTGARVLAQWAPEETGPWQPIYDEPVRPVARPAADRASGRVAASGVRAPTSARG